LKQVQQRTFRPQNPAEFAGHQPYRRSCPDVISILNVPLDRAPTGPRYGRRVFASGQNTTAPILDDAEALDGGGYRHLGGNVAAAVLVQSQGGNAIDV
jgi:hypothetical protein